MKWYLQLTETIHLGSFAGMIYYCWKMSIAKMHWRKSIEPKVAIRILCHILWNAMWFHIVSVFLSCMKLQLDCDEQLFLKWNLSVVHMFAVTHASINMFCWHEAGHHRGKTVRSAHNLNWSVAKVNDTRCIRFSIIILYKAGAANLFESTDTIILYKA